MSKQKVVLAYSGGLDTSYCVKYLSQEKNMDVYAALVNTGGFTEAELEAVGQRARELGVKEFVVLDEVKNYYESCIRFLVYGNILKGGVYPLSVSAERMFQALAIVNHARALHAEFIAHGSTGAGNDQVRFDLAIDILAPGVEIITPIRDQSLSREAEIEYLKSKGVEMSWEKAQYSINKGLWGTSVGGKETLGSWDNLPESAYPTQLSKEGEEEVILHFEKGELKGLNDTLYAHPVDAITALNDLAAPYGIGRDTHVGDTIIGIKGRVGFEAAAPLIIIKAHQLMEKHVLSKWQQHWKEQLGNWYGMLLHEGQYLEPVMRDVEVFLENTQSTVTGKVRVKLMPYRFQLVGIDSKYDLMAAKFGTYGEMNKGWSGDDVRGFTKILANANKIHRLVNGDAEQS